MDPLLLDAVAYNEAAATMNLSLDLQAYYRPVDQQQQLFGHWEEGRNSNTQSRQWWRFRRLSWPAVLPLNEDLTSEFVSKATDSFVMGLFTLASFVATFLWAWGKGGKKSKCIPVSKDSWSWEQVFASFLPLAIFPLVLCASGLAKCAETEKSLRDFVAGCCLIEFISIFMLGAEMAYCIVGFPFVWVLVGTLLIIFFAVVLWASTFRSPKCLRCFAWFVCLHQSQEAEGLVLE